MIIIWIWFRCLSCLECLFRVWVFCGCTFLFVLLVFLFCGFVLYVCGFVGFRWGLGYVCCDVGLTLLVTLIISFCLVGFVFAYVLVLFKFYLVSLFWRFWVWFVFDFSACVEFNIEDYRWCFCYFRFCGVSWPGFVCAWF